MKIQHPDHAGDAYFCGRHGKSCDSINVQYIYDRFGQVRHVITGLSGATHNKTVASWSRELMDFWDNLPAGYVVLGEYIITIIQNTAVISRTIFIRGFWA